LAVAERYRSEELIAHVMDQVAQMGDLILSRKPWRSALFKFMVEVVYLHRDELDFLYRNKRSAKTSEIDMSKVNDFDGEDLETTNLSGGWEHARPAFARS
jgi:hypothetical protein